MIKHKIFFLLMFLFICLQLWAQENLVIIDEQNDIRITESREDFMWFIVNKKVTYKIISDDGAVKVSTLTLPEKFDPTYISHFPKERNFQYVFSKMKVNFFKASVVSEDGSKYNVDVEEEIEEIEMLQMDLEYYGDFKKFRYHISNLKAGDELTVEYSYTMPYGSNITRLSSFRIFLNSDIFKEKYQMNIAFDPELVLDFDFLNNADPDTLINTETNTTYQWNRENLFGCINEAGARPYLDLPHIVFSPKPFDLYYTVPKSFEERFTPFYVVFARLREERHPAITLSIGQGVNTRQYNQIKRFIKNETMGMDDDTTGFEKIKKMHQTIADDFLYADDLDYFTREDIRDPKLGDQIGNSTLKDLSRNDLYLALMLSLELNYFTTYLSDNRSGVMSESYFAPMYDNDILYSAYISDDNFTYLYPKRARYGYYLNEIPFYFENTRARLVHLSDYLKKERQMNESFRQFILPSSTVSDNIRNSKVAVNVNLDDLSATFSAQVYLSGQFSTMTRGLYLYDYEHEKVNDLYNEKIWELNDEVVVQHEELDIKTKEFPFTTQLKAQYKADNLISKKENTYTMDLSNWFRHIIYENFSAENRQTDFYPDFTNRDSYLYFIQFDKNVKLEKSTESFEIDNGVVNMIIDISQLSPNSIKIQSFFAVAGKIELADVNVLEEVYHRLQELNSSRLVFSLE
ncbi:MAG: hypothetical protein HOG34_10045 [Bacteroidetes bacterium]|jgi:hypothetical protein|nr:hypothetical protein [Bacteroidota bacterium]MBT4408988.1 hypothetical protein [Bacteroidota bacterium]